MKILIFRTCSVPININSYNVQEIGLAKSIIDSGNECGIIFYTKNKKNSVEKIKYKEHEIPIYWLNGFNFFHHGIYDYKTIKEIASNYDILQCSDYNQFSTYKMLKCSPIPVVIYHGPYRNKFTWKTNIIDFIFDFIFLKKIIKIQPMIIAKSELAATTLLVKGFKNVKVIPVGLDISRFLNSNNDMLCSDKKIMLYIGQISKRRSIDFLIDLEKECLKNNLNCKLILIGNGPKKYVKHIINRIKKENLIEYIEWIKSLSQEELCKYYNSSTVFLLPSKYEIFGMVLLEAKYFNLPIISTLNGGSSSIIKSSLDGYIIDNFNVIDWEKKVEKVFKDKKNKQNFCDTWSDRIISFIEIYDILLSKKEK